MSITKVPNTKEIITILDYWNYQEGDLQQLRYKVVEIFDTKSRELLFTLPALHTSYIWCLCNINIESKGNIGDNLLITGSNDKTLKIWDLNRRTCKCTLTGHENAVNCILAHSSGYLLTGSWDTQ